MRRSPVSSPSVGETAEETRWDVSNKAVPAPSTVGLRPPPSLDWLCLKALAKDPRRTIPNGRRNGRAAPAHRRERGLLAPRSEVSEWVRVTLAPSLAARRVASRRGTVTGSGRLGSRTPPGVHTSEVTRRIPAFAGSFRSAFVGREHRAALVRGRRFLREHGDYCWRWLPPTSLQARALWDGGHFSSAFCCGASWRQSP